MEEFAENATVQSLPSSECDESRGEVWLKFWGHHFIPAGRNLHFRKRVPPSQNEIRWLKLSSRCSVFVVDRLSGCSQKHSAAVSEKKTALLAKRTLKLIEAKQRPKQLMKPESQLMMYLLNKQGHPIQAESINTPNMENTEAISKKKNDLFVLGLWDSPYMSGKSQPELLTRSVLVHVNCTADTGDPLSCNWRGWV